MDLLGLVTWAFLKISKRGSNRRMRVILQEEKEQGIRRPRTQVCKST